MKHVAIVGCGQLARMLALAGWRMGLRFSFIACNNEETYCIQGLGDIVHWPAISDPQEIYRALGKPDVVTVERESVPTSLLTELAQHCPVYPNADAVSACQHRLREKALLDELGILSAQYGRARTGAEIEQIVAELGYPLVVKAASDGYDGKQQWRLQQPADLVALLQEVASEGDWLVERLIAFDYEVSFIAARSSKGEIAGYPPTRNVHSNGILVQSSAPAVTLSPALQECGEHYLKLLMERMDYVGVLAVECFVVDDSLLVNELAPRVHNSGHWTMQAGLSCQFENHLRGILGLPLGSTQLRGYGGMVNILGKESHPVSLEKLPPRAALHWYNKPFAAGRKLGHFGVTGATLEELSEQLNELRTLVGTAS